MPGKRHRLQPEEDIEIDPSTNGKRKRQFTEQDEKLAQIYDRLADEKSDQRINAAKDLLEQLSIADSAEAQVDDNVLKRLIRGLCSGRKSARYGFFIALTEVLRQAYGSDSNINVDPSSKRHLVSTIASHTKSEGKAVGQEKRDFTFGRLYACKSIVQSGILFKLDSDIPAWDDVLNLIIHLAKSTPWIREECGMVLCDSINELSKSDHANLFARTCLEQLESHGLTRSPEGVAVWLAIQSKLPLFNAFPSNGWLRNDPLHRDNSAELNRAMREQFYNTEVEKKDSIKSGFWQQSVHFAWHMVLQTSMDRSRNLQDGCVSFGDLWRSLVDGALCSEKSSLERKYWGCQLFSRLITKADPEALPHMFSSNFIHIIMEHASENQKLLHDATKECLKKLKSRVQSQPHAAEIIMVSLTKSPGTPFFDRITKTKTLEEVLASTNDENFLKCLNYLEKLMINQQGRDQKTTDNTRQAIADLILAAFKVKSKNEDTDVSAILSEIFNIFLRFAYCVPRHTQKAEGSLPSPEISSASRSIFHSRTSSLIGHLLSTRPSNISKYAWKAVHKLKSMTKSSKSYRLALEADDAIWEILFRAYTVAESLEKGSKKASKKSFDSAICLFFCLALLQAYSGDTGAVTDLEDLYNCQQSIAVENSTGAHFDLLLELLLGFLSKPSALFRSMAEQVFTAISSSLTGEALQSLIGILRTSESFAGQQELFHVNADGTDNDGSDSSEDDDSVGSDVEVVDADGDTSGEDSENEEQSSAEEEQGDDELVQFNEKLAKVLQTSAAADKDATEESDGESMDDEQMMELDHHIVKVFRERHLQKSKQKEKKEAKGNVTNFKRRVLDLLSIYVKQESNNPLVLQLLLPLLEIMRTTKEKSLETKASEVLKALYNTCSKSKQLPKSEKLTDAVDILRDIHQEVQRTGSKFHSAACSRASLFVAKLLVSLDGKNYDKVLEVYSKTQQTWFQKKGITIQPTFFTEWVSFSVEMRKHK